MNLKYQIKICSPLLRSWTFEHPIIYYWISSNNIQCKKICNNIHIIGVVTCYGELRYELDLSGEVEKLYIDADGIYILKHIEANWTLIIGKLSLLLQFIIDSAII